MTNPNTFFKFLVLTSALSLPLVGQGKPAPPASPIERMMNRRNDALAYQKASKKHYEKAIEKAEKTCKEWAEGLDPEAAAEIMEGCLKLHSIEWLKMKLRDATLAAKYFQSITRDYLESVQERTSPEFMQEWADSGTIGHIPFYPDGEDLVIETPLERYRAHNERQQQAWEERVRRFPHLADDRSGRRADGGKTEAGKPDPFPIRDPQAAQWMPPKFIVALQQYGARNRDVHVDMPAPSSFDDLNGVRDTRTDNALWLAENSRVRPTPPPANPGVRRTADGSEVLVGPLGGFGESTETLHRDLSEVADSNRLSQAESTLLGAARRFQGIPYNPDSFGCTHFNELFVREIHPQASQETIDQIHISGLGGKNSTETQRNIRNAVAAERNLARGVGNGDPRLRGVVHALSSANLATEIKPQDARVGDMVQYWRQTSSGAWEGHTGIIFSRSSTNPSEIRLYGAHNRGAGRVAVSSIEVDLSVGPVYAARINDDVTARYRERTAARQSFSGWRVRIPEKVR